jgi:hypothetical protein
MPDISEWLDLNFMILYGGGISLISLISLMTLVD